MMNYPMIAIVRNGVNPGFLHRYEGLQGHTPQRLSGQVKWRCRHSTVQWTRWTELSTCGKLAGIWNVGVSYKSEKRGSSCQETSTVRRAHSKAKYPQMLHHHLWGQIQHWQLWSSVCIHRTRWLLQTCNSQFPDQLNNRFMLIVGYFFTVISIHIFFWG